jgi:Tol biopolymer transport system component
MRQTPNKPIWFFIGSLAFLSAAGCGDSSGPGEPEDPGVLVVPPALVGYYPAELVWTRDGSELVYVSSVTTPASSTRLNAVSVATHAVRQLNASPSIISLARESAGSRIYFGVSLTAAALNEPNFQVSRVDVASGTVDILATRFQESNNPVLVSGDERFLVAGSGLYDLQTGGRVNLPAGTPIDFSPDRTMLLYFLQQTGTSTQSATLISTSDGSSHPLLYSTGDFYLAHRWEGNSPQLLKKTFTYTGNGNSGTVRLSEIDGITGTSRDIVQFNVRDPFIGVTWSPDGRALGAWIPEGSLADKTDKTTLYIVRAGNAPAVVATVHGDPGSPVFSPDGKSIAYFYYHDDRRSLYMKSGI